MMKRLVSFVLAVACQPWAGTALAQDVPSRQEIEIALKAGQPEQLAQVLKKLGQAPKDQAEYSFYRGLIHLKREQADLALAAFASIPASSAYYLDARNNMAAIYTAQGKYNQAKSTLEDAIKGHQSLGVIYKNLNDLKSHLANRSYASALQIIDPDKGHKLALVVSTGLPPLAPAKPAAVLADAVKAPGQDKDTPSAKPSPAVSSAPVVAAATPNTSPPEPAVSKPANKTDAAVATASAESAQDIAGALQALQEWARAWEHKDVERYLKAYTPDFTAADGKAHAQWAKERQSKILSKNSIRLQLKQIEPNWVGKHQVRIRFRQHYQADQLKVSSDKTIEMKWLDQRWLITSERNSEGAQR